MLLHSIFFLRGPHITAAIARQSYRRSCGTASSSAASTRNISPAGPCGPPLSQICSVRRFQSPRTGLERHDPAVPLVVATPARQPPAVRWNGSRTWASSLLAPGKRRPSRNLAVSLPVQKQLRRRSEEPAPHEQH